LAFPSCHQSIIQPVRGRSLIGLIVRGISSENVVGFQWKLRIFSTGPVTWKEDTAPAEKAAAAIAALEKERAVKPVGGKKAEPKGKAIEAPAALTPPGINPAVLHKIDGEQVVLAETQIESLLAGRVEPEPHSAAAGPGEDPRDQIAHFATKLSDSWDQYEATRPETTKLLTSTQPKVEEK
jgi:hypothetical protein